MAELRPSSQLSISEARDWLRPRTEQPGGVQCPVCGQHAQAYKRSVTSAMVHVMRRIREQAIKQLGTPTGWVKLADVEQESRDTAMLAYWGLIYEHGEKRGWWQITGQGEKFLQGDLAIEKYAHVYRGKVYAHTGQHVRVFDVDPKFKLRPVERDEPEQTRLED